MALSRSTPVSRWLSFVSKRASWIALWGVALWPAAAWAGLPEADRFDGTPAKICPSCNPGHEASDGAGAADENELVLGCLDDEDCGDQGLCVKEEGASEDEPGDCVLSASDIAGGRADDSGKSTPVEPPGAQIQCSQANVGGPGGWVAIAILAGLNVLVFLRRTRRRAGGRPR